MSSFTEQWTEKTFTNDDGVKLVIRKSNEYPETLEMVVDGLVFWVPDKNVDAVTRAMKSIAGV